MRTAIVSGSSGLIGSEACKFFHQKGFRVVGLDNDMRSYFFGENASTTPMKLKLLHNLPNYEHHETDIRNFNELAKIFSQYSSDIEIIVHAAAQPSHDWAVREPLTDFGVNATGTLNMLEATRQHAPKAVFIFTSTNKVYGDRPNSLPLIEQEHRYEIDLGHPFGEHGIDESMSIDNTLHSIFGAGKVSADIMVQEYGRYFQMKTGVFRCGCLTGPAHAGAELHGFLAYLVKCAVLHQPYRVFGYKGKQVRDNIHSKDLINAFWEFFQAPRNGEVYNMGGSRFANISMLEAIQLIGEISNDWLQYTIVDQNRIGDHIWYVSDVRKFQQHYPNWHYEYDIKRTLAEMIEATRTNATV